MREVVVDNIKEVIKEMYIEMNYQLGDDVKKALLRSKQEEESPLGKEIISDLIKNTEIAKNELIPICQDTGMAVIFIDVGQEVSFIGGDLNEAINEGVRQAYTEGYLRKSVVSDPLIRENTKDNTPAVVHYNIIPGDKVKIVCAAKGFGSENMSKVKMLKPADGKNGVVDFVVETVSIAGPNPCPPIVVGVGIGGTMEKAAILAKKALTRPIGEKNKEEYIEEMEDIILEKINLLGIGPQGLGGRTTAFAVNIETYPTHIAGLPVAVNINCHVSRHKEITI